MRGGRGGKPQAGAPKPSASDVKSRLYLLTVCPKTSHAASISHHFCLFEVKIIISSYWSYCKGRRKQFIVERRH